MIDPEVWRSFGHVGEEAEPDAPVSVVLLGGSSGSWRAGEVESCLRYACTERGWSVDTVAWHDSWGATIGAVLKALARPTSPVIALGHAQGADLIGDLVATGKASGAAGDLVAVGLLGDPRRPYGAGVVPPREYDDARRSVGVAEPRTYPNGGPPIVWGTVWDDPLTSACAGRWSWSRPAILRDAVNLGDWRDIRSVTDEHAWLDELGTRLGRRASRVARDLAMMAADPGGAAAYVRYGYPDAVVGEIARVLSLDDDDDDDVSVT